MTFNLSDIDIHLTFSAADLAAIQQAGTTIPPFWSGHALPPQVGDVVRLADRQFAISGRAWEHNGERPVLRLYMTAGTHRTDQSLH